MIHIHCAEITKGSLTNWSGYAHDVRQPPPFGALITMHNSNSLLWGFVTDIITQTTDNIYGVYPYALSEQELQREHPEISGALLTEVQGIIIGQRNPTTRTIHRASTPPPLHAHVTCATADQYRQLMEAGDFFPILLAIINDPTLADEIAAALITQLTMQEMLTGVYRYSYAEWFFRATGNDYGRLKKFLQRLPNDQRSP